MIPLNQYGSLFAAAGCKLNFDSKNAQLEVVGIPKKLKSAIDAAILDIDKFENTSNFADGMSAIHLADLVDGKPNTLTPQIRSNVLNALGITKDSKFVAQVIAQQKTNRSWHTSKEPNKCTHFGDICTNRGITNVPGKRGRKGTRSPEQYHILLKTGVIQREQLVTPALENLVASIPAANIISVTTSNGFVGGINLDELSEDEIKNMLEKLGALREARKESVNV